MRQIQDGSLTATERPPAQTVDLTRYLVLPGRILFSAIFIMSALGHFSRQTIDYAAQHGVPMADIAVPLSGVMALAGSLSILLGYRARIGAWLVILFLAPVTVTMHSFWAVSDPTAARMDQIHFMKNMSMLGAALLIAHFGAGPMSLDAWRQGRRRTPAAEPTRW